VQLPLTLPIGLPIMARHRIVVMSLPPLGLGRCCANWYVRV